MFKPAYIDRFTCHCFGGGGDPAPPKNPRPGKISTAPVTPDPSQAHMYRGSAPDPNMTGRAGGGLLLDAAEKASNKTALGQ